MSPTGDTVVVLPLLSTAATTGAECMREILAILSECFGGERYYFSCLFFS